MHQVPGFYRKQVGDLTVTALQDGFIPRGFDDLIANVPAADQQAELARQHLPTQDMLIGLNGFLVQGGGQTVLIDTGAAAGFGPTCGHLAENLAAAGTDAGSVDLVLMTHLHADHANGLLTNGGTPAFPNAEIRVAEAEVAFWHDDAMAEKFAGFADFFTAARAAVAPYGDRVTQFSGAADMAHGITAQPLPGHTPGHTGYLISSGAASLMVWGDIAHSQPLQLAHPDWSVVFDIDPDQARDTRRKILDQVTADGQEIAGMHLIYPGLGFVDRKGDGFALVPSRWDYGV